MQFLRKTTIYLNYLYITYAHSVVETKAPQNNKVRKNSSVIQAYMQFLYKSPPLYS